MEGTFATILVEPFEETLQETKDMDNYWNRGETAKYINESHGMKNATEPIYLGANPRGTGVQSKRASNKLAPPFSHAYRPPDTHGLHTQQKFVAGHEPVFDCD